MGTQKRCDAKTLEKNETFLNRLFYRSLEKPYLQTLFPDRPEALSVMVFYAQEGAVVHFSKGSLIHNCNACIQECGLSGHAFLSGHDYFIFLIENREESAEKVSEHFARIRGELLGRYDIQTIHHTEQLCAVDESLGRRIPLLINEISSVRYYGKRFSKQEMHTISNVRLQKALDSIEGLCELGNVEEAAETLRKLIQSSHEQYFSPMNVKRSALRLMYAFFSIKSYHGEETPYYDIPHFIIEQVLKADVWYKTEQVVDAFCAYVIRTMASAPKPLPESIKDALQFIHTNYNRPIRLKEVAEAIHLNKSYLSQLFQKTMGVTYSDYLEALRIESAKHYLKTTTKTASEIAEIVGFSSQNYFTKVFKNSVGISPIRFRSSKIS